MIALLATVMTVVAGPFLRAQQAVDLELLLAVDVSWSMDLDEQQLQREGYIGAHARPRGVAGDQQRWQ